MARQTKKLLVILATLLVVAGVSAYVVIDHKLKNDAIYTDNQEHTPEEKKRIDETLGHESVDEVSGETILVSDEVVQAREANEPPAMLGFSNLEDYGLNLDQRTSVRAKLADFSNSQSPRIDVLSFYKDSYKKDGATELELKMRADSGSDYIVLADYSSNDQAKVTVYSSDKSSVVFEK